MPKGKGYGTKRSEYESGYVAVNQNYSTPHQKVIQIEPRPKATGQTGFGGPQTTVIGITSMGNHKHGKQKMGY